MRKIIFTNGHKRKTVILSSANWNKTGYKGRTCYYQHKAKKRLFLHYDMQNKTGIFWDEKKKIPISEPKNIRWT